MNESSTIASICGAMLAAESLIPLPCPSLIGHGRYELQELISLGKRSWVYRAKDLLLSSDHHEHIVVVKVYRTEGSQLRESTIAASVNDDNILRILDRGTTTEGFGYIVTEFVPDGDLGHQQIPWSPQRAAAFVAALARTVQSAHARGVVHCDIKPDNILVSTKGLPKLADFELSLREGEDDERIRGTRGFMAPEQAVGGLGALTPLADIYAIGGVLYYLLTGNLPNESDPATRRINLEASLRDARCPRRDDLIAICEAALQTQREDRYQFAEALAIDLENWAGHRPISRRKAGLPRTLALAMRRNPVRAVIGFAAVVVTALLIGGGVWWRIETVQRDLAAKLEANRIAAEEIEETKARLRVEVKSMYYALKGGSGTTIDAVLPALSWLDWISEQPAFRPVGILTPPERLEVMRGLRSEEFKSARTVESLVLNYAIGQLELVTGNVQSARAEFQHVLTTWTPTLEPADPLLERCRILHACADAECAEEPQAAKARASARAMWQKASNARSPEFDGLVLTSLKRGHERSLQTPVAKQ